MFEPNFILKIYGELFLSLDALELSETLAFKGILTAREAGFDLTYYFPGPDRRYNGTILKIDSSMLEQYITAWQDNWHMYRILSASVQSASFSAQGTLGMTISSRGVQLYQLRVESDSELCIMLDNLRYAQMRGAALRQDILGRLGRTEMSADEKLMRFARFMNGEDMSVCTNPLVGKELGIALLLVRSKLKIGINSCRHHVSNWFGKQAAQDFMEDVRRHGLEVFCEQATFIISWSRRA